jgi:DNA adenine methylase
MGSKNRISKYILPTMLASRKPDQWWVEPFVGGGNMIDKVEGKRIGADADPYVIHALLAIRDHLDKLPKNNQEFTEDDYKKLRQDDSYSYKGYAGFTFSYCGKWMGGWSRDCDKNDYVLRAYKNAVIQSPKLQGVILINTSYENLDLPKNSLIYCDPPYEDTTKYSKTFKYKNFWDWCRTKGNEGHTVFISEYKAPNDFECLWEKKVYNSLTKDSGSKTGIEKLFKYKV